MTRNDARRNFLKSTAAGAFSGLLLGAPSRADAQSPAAALPPAGFSVRAYGATGDGKALDTAAIQRAIDAAAAAGGGTVFFPAGQYLSYTIHLRSHVGLHLDQGAVLIAADSPGQAEQSGYYDLAEPNPAAHHYQDFGHTHFHNSLMWGDGLENIAITGPGRIWGRGLSKGWGPGPQAKTPGVGNKSIALKNCRNILLRDFSILHGGHFGILATGVDNLTIDNLTIDTNRDGMDIDCCRNVRVSNCTVNSPSDDGICLKSSFALGETRATEKVTISDCLVSAYAEGSVLDGTFRALPLYHSQTGRIKFGTESNGGFKNITITNCVFDQCQGLALETVDGAHLEDVAISNITMRDVSSTPLFLRLGRRMRGPKDLRIGVFRRVLISNIVCSMPNPRTCSIIAGIPGHPVEDVCISDLFILENGGGAAGMANVEPPEQEKGYPGPGRLGPMPASGFFIRHARGIELRNIRLQYQRPDARPVFVVQNVDGLDVTALKVNPRQHAPTFRLANVRNFDLRQSRPLADTFEASVTKRDL